MADWGSGGGGGGKKKPKAAPSTDPNVSLYRLAARLQEFSRDPYAVSTNKKGIQRTKYDPAKINRALAEALRDYTPEQVVEVAKTAKLTPRATQLLRDAAGDTPKAQGIATILDYLNRPSQTVLGAVSEGPSGALRGLTGKERYTGIQTVLRLTGKSQEEAAQAEANLPGVVRFGGNLAIETVADPTTWVSFGSAPAARAAARTFAAKAVGETGTRAIMSPAARGVYQRLLTQGVKGLDDAERAVLKTMSHHIQRKVAGVQGGIKVAGRTLPHTGGTASALGPKAGALAGLERMAVPRAGIRQAERAGDLLPGTREEVANMMARLRGATKQGDLRQLQARKLGLTKTPLHHVAAFTDDEKRRIFDALDVGGGPEAVAALPPKMREAATKLRTELSDEDFAILRQSGRLGEVGRVPQSEYITHYLSPEAETVIRRGGELPVARIGGPDPGFLKARTGVGPASAAEPLESGAPRYLLNPFEAVGRHARQTTIDAARVRETKALSELVDSAGQPLMIVDPNEVKRLSDATDVWAKVDAPVSQMDEATGAMRTRGQTVLVRKEIAPDVQRVFKFMQGDMDDALQTLSRINSIWARMATANPGFIARNVLQGNIWAGVVLAEARNPVDWITSMRAMSQMLKGVRKTGNPLQFLKGSQARLVKEAMDEFAVGSGFISSLKDMAGPGGASLASKAGRVAMKPVDMIAATNRFAEEWGHLAVFFAKRRQGYNAAEAAGIVRKYLLDYSDLSTFDRGVRYINPFFTWTRKNTPLIIATALKNPGKLTKFQHLMEGIGREGDQPEGLVPEWMRQAGGIPVSGNKMFLPDFPQYAAADTVQWATSLKEVIRGKPGAEVKLARDLINAVGLGGAAGGAARLTAEIAGGSEFFSGRKVTPGEQVPTPSWLSWIPGIPKTIPFYQQKLLDTAIPLSSRERAIVPKTEADKAAQARRLISLLTGVTLFPVGEAQSRSEAYRRLGDLQVLQRMLEGKGYKIPDDAPMRSGSKQTSSRGGW